MSYPLHVHEAAFQLHLKGLRPDEIRETLRRSLPNCGQMGLGTIESWKLRDRWVARATEIQRYAQAKLDEARGDFLAETLADLVAVRRRLSKSLRSMSPNSLEGAVDGYLKIARFERTLRGLDRHPGPRRVDKMLIAAIGDKTIELLMNNATVGPAFRALLERHRGALIEDLTRSMTQDAGSPKPEAGVPMPDDPSPVVDPDPPTLVVL